MIKPTRTKMASSSVTWLSVIVKSSQQIVKDRTILKCSWEDTTGSLLLRLGNDLEAETIYDVVISNNDKFVDPHHKVPIDAPVIVRDHYCCMFLCLYLTEKETTRPAPSKTITDALMCLCQIEVISSRESCCRLCERKQGLHMSKPYIPRRNSTGKYCHCERSTCMCIPN